MSSDEFDKVKARLTRILHRCGWSIHLRYKPSGWYAGAARRDTAAQGGKVRQVYIAPMHKLSDMTTEKIKAILPPEGEGQKL